MPAPLPLKDRVVRKLPRLVKAGRQWLRVLGTGTRPETRLVFVVGSQRSGTRLPMQVMDHAPAIATFSEGSAPYFDGVLLQPLDRVQRLVERSPFPIVALKPICETHRIHELLDRFPRSKAVWIFRNYQDAVNSASVKWTSGREAVRRLAHGELKAAGWRSGGLTPERLELVKRLYRDDMSLHDANAVMWYLRNRLFFDLHAGLRPGILLVRYEDLTGNPSEEFARVFEFIDVPAPAGFARAVAAPARSKRPFPAIASEIRTLCEELNEQLLTWYRSRGEAGRIPMAGGARR